MTIALQDSVSTPVPAPLRLTDLHVGQAGRADPLGKCVQDALETYLRNMDGHDVTDLYRLVIEEVERPLFDTVVRHADGNLTLAARLLGLTRSTLRKRLTDYGIARGR